MALFVFSPTQTHSSLRPEIAFAMSQTDKKDTLEVLTVAISAQRKEKKSIKLAQFIDNDTATLLVQVGPVGTIADTTTQDVDFDVQDITTYTVRKGDTLSAIAEIFDVSAQTVAWANNLSSIKSKVKFGAIMTIPPIDGYRATIAKGDTLESIANKYNGSVEDIVFFNEGISSQSLVSGKKIFIPGGEKPAPQKIVNKKATSSKNTPSSSASSSVKAFTGKFIKPVNGRVTSPYGKWRGKRIHKGIDFGAASGTPVYATAGGKVIKASYGWNGAFGNMIEVQHKGGEVSLYAHLSKINVKKGDTVKQGKHIGAVGSTGRSTGPHLHYELRINGKSVNPSKYAN